MKNIGVYMILAAFLTLATVLASCAPSIPHSTEGRKECITCHGITGVKPFPNWHAKKGYGNDACSNCHDVKIKDR